MPDKDSNENQNDPMLPDLPRDEKGISLLREIAALLYENRDDLIREWAKRISKYYLFNEDLSERFIEHMYPVFDSYAEALKTGTQETVESYIFVLTKTLSAKELENCEITGVDSLIRNITLRSLISEYNDDFDKLNEILDVFEPVSDRLINVLSKRLSQAYRLDFTKQQVDADQTNIPMLILFERLLVIPLAGKLDIYQLEQMTTSMLETIKHHRIQVLVMDMTGVKTFDDEVIKSLGETLSAAKIMGTKIMATGISFDMARKLASHKAKWPEIITFRELSRGIKEAKKQLNQTYRSEKLVFS